VRTFPQPIRMQYVVKFSSMQYMSTSVDTGAEGTLSTAAAKELKAFAIFHQTVKINRL